MGRLGADPSAPLVVSRRNNQEKQPWRSLAGIENRVEYDFLHPILLGESILPYRVFHPLEGVVPVTEKGVLLDSEAAANRGFDGLHGWMSKAEAVWNAKAESGQMTVSGRWNYHNELTRQFPIAPLRVIYAASGSLPAACLLRDQSGVIDNSLYWMALDSEAEGRYLTAILNSETARKRAAVFQSRGQFGARHFHKVMFNLPIPRFDAKVKLHRDLAGAAAEAEALAANVIIPEGVKFQRARGMVRAALTETGIAQKIDGLVAALLDGAT